MATPKTAPKSFELAGGHPVLDFVNTVGGKRTVAPREQLERFHDVVAWASQAGVVTASEAKALAHEATAHPGEAQEALVRARAFREALYGLLLALLESRPAAAADVAAVEAEVHRAQGARKLEATPTGIRWTRPDVPLLDAVVPRLALAAAELLTSGDFGRVRLCEATRDDDCGWLFLDETRNHSRRWCDMATCGNQHKARRHYARVRAQR